MVSQNERTTASPSDSARVAEFVRASKNFLTDALGGIRDKLPSRQCADVAAPSAPERRSAEVPWIVEFHKVWWRPVSLLLGQRSVLEILFPGTLLYYDLERCPGVRRKVALTFDDGPCRQPDAAKSMIPEVQRTLAEFGAKATFFLCTDFVPGHEARLRSLLREGHEVANHCPADRTYSADSERDFEAALLRAERVCDGLRAGARAEAVEPRMHAEGKESSALTCRASVPREPAHRGDLGSFLVAAPAAELAPKVRWFRAPCGQLSSTMRGVLNKHGFTHVLGDCYVNDVWIDDHHYIADNLVQHVTDGSIVILHVPERGFREHNLASLRETLAGLKRRDIQVVTLTSLYEASSAAEPQETKTSLFLAWQQRLRN